MKVVKKMEGEQSHPYCLWGTAYGTLISDNNREKCNGIMDNGRSWGKSSACNMS